MATAATRGRKAAAPKAAPAPEPETDEFEEEIEDEDADLEELEESDDEPVKEEKPKRKPPTRPKIDFGSPELASYVTEKTGENYSARDIRMLLRKLAKDGKLAREVGVDKQRYEFTGPNDATVKLVLKMIQDGTAKALKQEGLQKVKDLAAERKAAKAAAAEAKAEDEMEEVEEEEEAPKPTRRRAAAPAKATPAKATATTRRRASAAK